MRDKITNKSRCFGFVVFKNENTVDLVMQAGEHFLNWKSFECKVAVPKELINKSDENKNLSKEFSEQNRVNLKENMPIYNSYIPYTYNSFPLFSKNNTSYYVYQNLPFANPINNNRDNNNTLQELNIDSSVHVNYNPSQVVGCNLKNNDNNSLNTSNYNVFNNYYLNLNLNLSEINNQALSLKADNQTSDMTIHKDEKTINYKKVSKLKQPLKNRTLKNTKSHMINQLFDEINKNFTVTRTTDFLYPNCSSGMINESKICGKKIIY